MTTPDRAASPARRDAASSSMPDQLPLAMLLALLLVPGALTTIAFVALAPLVEAVGIVRNGRVTAHDGASVTVRADTICIHGDTPGATDYAAAVRTALARAGVTIAALGR